MARQSGSQTSKATAVPLGSSVVLVVSQGPAAYQAVGAPTPRVAGLAQADALEAIQGIGLNTQVFTQTSQDYEHGRVIAQWPRAGELAASGSNAALLVSSGAAAEGTALTGVPTMSGMTEADARARLEQIGLHVSVLGAQSSTVPEGIVVGQLPEARTAEPVESGSKAWLWVAGVFAVLLVVLAAAWLMGWGKPAAQMVSVPDVVGLTQAEAEQEIEDAGLEIGKITESPSTTATANTVMSQDPAAGDEADEGSKVDLVVATESDLIEVPDVTGMSKDAALQSLARAQLQVSATEAASDDVPAGDVVSQSPKAGQLVPVDTEVGIIVSTGPAQTNVMVPDVTGLSLADAKAKLGEVGLNAKTLDAYSASVPADKIVGQAPPSGASVAPGTPVAMLVSKGPEPPGTQKAKVPNVVGMTLDAATAAIVDAGFKVTSFELDGSDQPAGQVLYQSPVADETAPLESQVALIVSSGK